MLTRGVKDMLCRVTCGGAPAYIWPGGGITLMADVSKMPKNAFGYVPTPALVAPVEFTMRLQDYEKLGGHLKHVKPLTEILAGGMGDQNDHELSGRELESTANAWPTDANFYSWSK